MSRMSRMTLDTDCLSFRRREQGVLTSCSVKADILPAVLGVPQRYVILASLCNALAIIGSIAPQ